MYDAEFELLQAALLSENGIEIRSEDIEHLRRRLEKAKHEKKELYGELIFRAHPPYIALFILKPEVPANAKELRPGEDDSLALRVHNEETSSVLPGEGSAVTDRPNADRSSRRDA